MNIFRRRISAADYVAAKQNVTDRIIRRLTRGNVKTQNGESMSTAKLLKKSREADERMQRTKELVEASA